MSKRTCSFPGCDRTHEAKGYCKPHYQQYWKGQEVRALLPRRPAGLINTIEAFWAKVNKGGPLDCWPWVGYRSDLGYGYFKSDGKTVPAYRFAYEQSNGSIERGLHIDHLCYNPSCVNPAHLRAVTHQANMQNRKGATSKNQTGFRGVQWTPSRKRYRAQVNFNRKRYHGGYFDTPEEAAQAARKLRQRLMPDSLNDL